MFHSLEAYIAGWGGPLFTLWKMHVLVWCDAGQLTVHFHAMNNGMEALCSCRGGAVLLATHIHDMKMAGARIFISCKMPALVWGVAGLLATHFHEMKNDRGGPVFHFMEKCIHIGCRAGSWFGHYCVHACSHGLDHGSR